MPACSVSSPAVTLPSGGKRKLLPVTLVAMAVFIMGSAFGMAHAQNTWITAQLSVTRFSCSATSVENEALFAGGATFKPSAFFFVLEDVDT
jgi:hypothetical protein